MQTEDAASAMCQIYCEIRALHGERLARTLDAALRSVTVHAALTGAVLETRVVRLAGPSVAPATLVQELARQLWRADLPVSFGPSWVPVAGADISVGVRGLRETFEAFLREHPAWQTLPRLR